MLGILQRPVAPGPETTHGADQHGCDPLTLIAQRDHPLVEIADLQYHLDLLGVFHKLHHVVDAAGIVVNPSTKVPIMSAAQGLFLARAQHRFDLWMTKILERPEREAGPLRLEELPPVDVLLLLHVYMLNPIAYREDVIRVYPCLARMGPFPWKAIHSRIDTSTFEMTGTPAQIGLWESSTAEPFEPPKSTLNSDTTDITCPRCLSYSKVPWKADEGKGLGEIGFHHVCTRCGLAIDSDALCVSKLLKDLSTEGPLAHTVLDKDGMEEIGYAREVSDDIRETLGCPGATDGDRFGWKVTSVKKALLGDVPENDSLHKWLSYVLSAYTHFGKASVDLKAAVLRQGRFVQSMHEILWAGPGSSFPGKEQALLDAVASYERYFALTKTHAHGLVPTLDVDLVFHTHQLAGPIYADDCFSILGHFLNHDDTESNPETQHDNIMQSIDLWNRVYGRPDNNDLPTKPKTGSRSLSNSSCEETLPANDYINERSLDLPRDPRGVERPRGPPGYCSPDPPPPRPPAPTKPHASNVRLNASDTQPYSSDDNPYERGLPPLYLPSGPGGGPGGGGPHNSCTNCDPKPPPTPPPTKPHTANAETHSGSDNPDERGLPPLYLPRGPGGGPIGPRGSCTNCDPKPPPPPPPPPTNTASAEAHNRSDNPYERGLPPFYRPRGPGGGGPHVSCTNCDPKPPPTKPTKPGHTDNATTHDVDEPERIGRDNTYERGLPPLYRPRGPGGGPGGGGPHGNCTNCDPVRPPPKPTKPGRTNDAKTYDERGGGDNPYERGLPPLYLPRGPGGGPGGGGPHSNCNNCDPAPPPPKPTKPGRTKDAQTHDELGGGDNPYERGLPPLYRPRGPGGGPGGGGPHGNCTNCDPVRPPPKPTKPGRAVGALQGATS
ncbi:hypothetical protein D9619_003574 [Psilocybe cf. subviscida]|uniref:Uncharacterized protein n=1 Tax=Psilocybe cf. subviscida TaxID=2480587 RepID=A0A8H5EUB3_9AGAR|nr:hypothetical protein D9619_003574 [Psilocybe cf. subviscida]